MVTTTAAQRVFIADMTAGEVRLKGWVYRLRVLGKTAFVILRDSSGEAQCVIVGRAEGASPQGRGRRRDPGKRAD
jgi:aspartyl/asparaginyl-tRNA synthetase